MIIEDQLPAQRVLKRYINDIPSLELTVTYEDCLSALEYLHNNSIDLLFLDINLPKISGLNFLRSQRILPRIIITTAYPQYAVEGFELEVIDYLLKPFSFERFLKAVSKIQPNTTTDNTPAEYSESFVFVKSDKAIHRIDFDQINFIQADGDFVHIVTEEKKYFISQTLKYWEAILPSHLFIRVHRSYIINLSKTNQIQGNQIKIKNATIPIGRSYRNSFFDRLDRLM